MKNLVKSILDRRFEEANDILNEEMSSIARRKLHEMKKMVAARMSEDQDMDAKLDKANNVQEAPDNEKFDSETGATTKTKQNRAMITINKLGQEKKSGEPEEEGDETHIHRSTETTTSGNGRDSTSTLSTRTSQKVIRPNKNDDTGGDYEVKSNTNLDRSSSETKKPSPKKGDEYDGETPVSESSGEESSMARSELASITKNVKSIMAKIKGNKELEAWTQSKITKAADYMTSVSDYMDGEKLDEARIGIVRARIRGGKIQRRKKVSLVPGMTMRGGTLTRMSPSERRRRKMGAKKAARKSKQKRSQMLRKRKLSLMKRQRLGI